MLEKSDEKTKKLLLFVLAISVALIMMMFAATDHISDAAVNIENGNVSVFRSGGFVDTYDSDGKLLYSKKVEYNSGGAAYLDYIDGDLHIKMLRNDIVVIWDENGEMIKKEAYFLTEADGEWNDGWSKQSTAYTLKNGSVTYRYDNQNFFKIVFARKVRCFEIYNSDSDEKITVWSSAE